MTKDRSFRLRTRGCTAGALLLAWILVATGAEAQAPPEYRMPPKAIADLLDAPPTPAVRVAPDGRGIALLERPALESIRDVARPELRLAGLRIDPGSNGPSRAFAYSRIVLKTVPDGTEREVTGLPADPRIRDVQWAPDGSRIAFSVTAEDAVELWIADVRTGAAGRLLDGRLSDVLGDAFQWLPDGTGLVVKLVPADRGAPPAAPDVPAGPVIQQNAGKVAPARTYQDLLENPHDEAVFEHYFTAQVARVELDGAVTPIGAPGLVARAEPSPNGVYLLVQTIHRPFSYLVPVYRFPARIEVWDASGKIVRKVADLPLAEEVPIAFDAVREGPRQIGWRADAPATLYWVEAQDGGDPRAKAEVRDRVFLLAAPFRGAPVRLLDLALRFDGIRWGTDDLALVSEDWRATRKTRTWVVRPGAPRARARLLFDRSSEDRYSDPGDPWTRRTPAGTSVLVTADGGRTLFFSGSGASPEGDRPFLDRLDVRTGKTQRVWRSEAPYYEDPVAWLDAERLWLLTSRESPSEPPNYFFRDLRDGTLSALTDLPHPAPALRDVHKELIQYERADGIALSATLYLPPGWESGREPPPMLMWAYPREYKSADAASQVVGSPYRFPRLSWGSPLLWLAAGFAVLDGPTMPIIGEGDEEPNDAYVEQLVASAQAAVDEVVRRGVADRDRIAIGGHSYGAFMTANLLAHSDLFRAGIARSGAYNRTLTPFGFQAEQRTFWQAPEVYFAMSPFMHADKVNEPILLIHGQADNNSGTFPIQSERLYHALKGHGATARLVMLPHESHGYRARESVMHMAWEMTEWLERYVRGASPRVEERRTGSR